MAELIPQHMIEELQENIKSRDAIKAGLVLNHLRDVDSKTQTHLVYLLSRAEAEFSVPLLLGILNEQSDVADQMPIIRETLLSTLLAYPEKLVYFLKSSDIKDKSELIKVAAELNLEEATQPLLEMLGEAEDAADIYLLVESLGQIGDPQAVSNLTEYLYAANKDLINVAINALGSIATPQAMQELAERMGTDSDIDHLILSIFSRVQDQISLEKLNETMRSHHAHMRTIAKAELVRIGPKAVPVLLENLSHSDSDFLIHTLNVLGDIGDDSAVNPIRKLLTNEPQNPNVRFAAYEALALLPFKKGLYTLTAGLTDPEDHVCIAAARAIDKNFSPILGAGIKNLLRGLEKDADHIAKSIVNAQVDNIFLWLADDEIFQKLALGYLLQTHKDIRTHYSQLLVQNGFKNFASQIVGEDEETVRPKIVAVDDSRMILNIYKVTLHELGYEPVLFEFPESALSWLKKEKPLVVFTDLNMPEITGIQLTEKIRETYSENVLPVIMVTTQNDMEDNEAAYGAGVNVILPKPFDAKSLGGALEKVLKPAG